MPFGDTIRILNGLKRRRVIREYAIIGAVAATAYMEPVFTEHLDIVVLVDTDEEYVSLFRRLAELSERREGMHYVFGGVPVQAFPTTTKPLYRDVLETARPARVGGLRVKVASSEHLVLLYLEAFRDKDKFRITRLLGVVDRAKLDALLVRYDDEQGTLAHRLQTLL